jgi:hypothetical protein
VVLQEAAMTRMRTVRVNDGWAGAKLEKAEKNYEKWHDKEPDKVSEASFTFPKEVFEAGRIVQMLYESDKWEADGDMYPYVHDFDSKPPIYCAKTVGGLVPYGASRSTAALLCTRDLNGTVALAELAVVQEITVEIEDEDGNVAKQRFAFKQAPLLAGTVDNKTLVLFHSTGPLFINGGRMRITERGIVY